MPYSIGLDYGTHSVRALVVDTVNGREIGTAVVDHSSGEAGILLDPRDHHLARQHPGDYLFGLERSVRGALAQAAAGTPDFSPDAVVGIGVDATGSSPIPVTAHNISIALHAPWKDHLSAQCWLWKDHTTHREAARITALAAKHRPHYLAGCGHPYSSEWFWSKIWRCLKVAPEVFDAAFSWVELADYIPATLCGVNEPWALMPGLRQRAGGHDLAPGRALRTEPCKRAGVRRALRSLPPVARCLPRRRQIGADLAGVMRALIDLKEPVFAHAADELPPPG